MDIGEIKANHERFEHRTANAPIDCWQAHQDRGVLLTRIAELEQEIENLKMNLGVSRDLARALYRQGGE